MIKILEIIYWTQAFEQNFNGRKLMENFGGTPAALEYRQ